MNPIEVFVRQGQMTNVLWVHIGGERYALSYNHDAQSIDMKHGGTQGPTVASFDNSTDLATIKQIFEAIQR